MSVLGDKENILLADVQYGKISGNLVLFENGLQWSNGSENSNDLIIYSSMITSIADSSCSSPLLFSHILEHMVAAKGVGLFLLRIELAKDNTLSLTSVILIFKDLNARGVILMFFRRRKKWRREH